MIVVVAETPFRVAVRVTTAWVVTFACPTVNVPLEAPAGIVRVSGTVAAAELELESATVTPPAGAGPLSVTVPVTVVLELPTTEVGLTAKVEGTGAFMVTTVV